MAKPINKTSKYLFPVFSGQSIDFKNHYNLLSRQGLYLNDHKYIKKHGVSYPLHIYVRVNTMKSKNFDSGLSFFRLHPLYADDYELEENEHMIVFRVPAEFKNTVLSFRHGYYSKMYDISIIEDYFQTMKGYVVKYDNSPLSFKKCEQLGSLEDHTMQEVQEKLYISPYYVLVKDGRLKTMLEALYDIEIPEGGELDSVPKMENEVYEYDEEVAESFQF